MDSYVEAFPLSTTFIALDFTQTHMIGQEGQLFGVWRPGVEGQVFLVQICRNIIFPYNQNIPNLHLLGFSHFGHLTLIFLIFGDQNT